MVGDVGLPGNFSFNFSIWCSGYHTRLVCGGDVGSNPTQGEFSFKHLFTKYDYLGCIGLVVLSYTEIIS